MPVASIQEIALGGSWLEDAAVTKFALSFGAAPAGSPPSRSNCWQVWGLPLMNNDFGVYPVVTSDQKWVRVDRHCRWIASISPDLPHFQFKPPPRLCARVKHGNRSNPIPPTKGKRRALRINLWYDDLRPSLHLSSLFSLTTLQNNTRIRVKYIFGMTVKIFLPLSLKPTLFIELSECRLELPLKGCS